MELKIHKNKLKKMSIFISLFFTLVILSPGFVSATDYSVSGNNFDSVQNVADSVNSGDTILLGNKTYTSGNNKNITIITDNIIVKGQSTTSKAKLNGQGTGSTIILVKANNIRLENLIFENANANVFGGAINSNKPNLTIINCEFINNKAMIGAIVLDNISTNAIIQNCVFVNNIAAYSNSSGGGGGGAIDSHSSHAKIINCRFTNNSAIGNGGAIVFMFGTNNTVSGCTFTNNNASNGAAIMTTTQGTTLNIINSIFNNNKAKNYGGAIYSLNSLTITNSNFTSNTATNAGAIYSNNTLNINNGNFNNNMAYSNGGSIYNTNTMSISGSTLTSNSANNGSAIYNTGKLNIINVNFINNRAKTYDINSPSIKVKYTDNIIINSYLTVGDNVVNAIYNKGNVNIDGVKPYQSDKPYGQNISLILNEITYRATTNSNGIATFTISTTNKFLLKNYMYIISYVNTGLFSSINKSSSVNIVKKEIISTSTNNKILSKVLQHYKGAWGSISKIGLRPEGKYRKAIKYKSTKIRTNTTFIATTSKVKNSTSTKTKKEKNKLTTTKTVITVSKLGSVYTKKTIIQTTVEQNLTNYEKINIYLLVTKDCNYKDPKIQALSRKLTKDKKTDLEKANAILYWVNNNIDYKGNKPRSASKTLSKKESNCVGIAHITVALFRASGLPARYQAKFYYDSSMYKTHSQGDNAHVGHVWAQLYINGKWRSADLWPIETKSSWDYIKLSKNHAVGYISAWEGSTSYYYTCVKVGKNHKFNYINIKR